MTKNKEILSQNYNVLHVLPALNIGGVELDTISLAKAQKKAGISPIIISSGGELEYKVKENDIPHITLNLSTKNPFKIWRNAKLLKKIINKYNINIVHAHSRAPAWSAYFSTHNNTNTKFITTFHGIYGYKGYFKKLYNSAMLKGDAIIAVSNYVKKHIRFAYGNSTASKINTIHRGVDKNIFAPTIISNEERLDYLKSLTSEDKDIIKPGKKILLLLARFTRMKGHLYLMEILQNVKRNDFICLMVGNLSQNKAYINDIKKSRKFNWLEDKVALVDQVTDVPKLIRAVDYVISSSTKPESFGLTTLQTQMMKKMSIATNIGGSKELIKNGETGFLIPHNSIPGAAKILEKILALPAEEYDKITNNAYNHTAPQFTIENATQKTIDVYQHAFGAVKKDLETK